MQPRSQQGFTLIEMIVSLGVFAVVVTITTGALLSLVYSNQRGQSEQNVMTNLSFAIDSMSRELRTGYAYYCTSANGRTGIFSDNDTHSHGNLGVVAHKDCDSAPSSNTEVRGVSFVEGGNSITGTGSTRILYFYDPVAKKIYRRVGDNPAQSLVSDSVSVTAASFIVTSTETLLSGSDAVQPTVTIFLEFSDSTNPQVSSSIETTVTQRSLDL